METPKVSIRYEYVELFLDLILRSIYDAYGKQKAMQEQSKKDIAKLVKKLKPNATDDERNNHNHAVAEIRMKLTEYEEEVEKMSPQMMAVYNDVFKANEDAKIAFDDQLSTEQALK